MGLTDAGGMGRTTFVKVGRARNSDGEGEHWMELDLSPTLNLFDLGDVRTCVAVCDYRGEKKIPSPQ